jgi:hypothetical protein
MKKLLFLTIVLALASCTAAPTQAPVQPVAQEPVVVTVVVQPTQAPVQQEPIVVTVVVEASPVPAQPTPIPPTQAPAAVASPADASGGPIVLDDLLGKGVFKSITLSDDIFSLRCLPREITFNITASLPEIVDAELFYRTVDQPNALYYTEWRSGGIMDRLGNGNFSMVFSGEDVNPDWRQDFGWFEFQFIGLNRGGGVVDRTQKIEKLVTYSIDCP